MLSQTCVCLSLYVTITHDALDLTVPAPQHAHLGSETLL